VFNSQVGFYITFCIVSVLMGYFLFKVSSKIVDIILDIRKKQKNNEIYKEKMKEVDDMKARGDHHEWIEIPIDYKNTLVCKKTGYCPHNNGFLPKGYIDNHLEKLKLEKEFNVYKDVKLKELAKEYSLSIEDIEELSTKVYSIKKEFSLSKMNHLIDELRSKGVRVISSLKELDEVMKDE